MVHLRINEREPNPNPYVNFITVLPTGDAAVEDVARQLLRALAAQVKPIMKTHGFVVNSLEEYEYNTVFAGRNWNNGETVELVLRSSSGSLLPTHWLLSTLCHELAHIKHMNHGPGFQALWHQLRQEVRALQCKGYYGDGYWSSGTRLADSARIAGEGVEMGELPEYMCGGAHSRARPVSRQPRKPNDPRTSKKRKAGTRVNSSLFNSVGKPLNEGLEGENKSHGIGFRKKAGSKRAREERAVAAEHRIQTLQGKASSSLFPLAGSDSESEGEKRDPETDCDRRRTLLEAVAEDDLRALKATMLDATQDFVLPNVDPSALCGNVPGNSVTSGGSGRAKAASSDTSESSRRPRKKRKSLQSQVVESDNTFTSAKTAKAAKQEGDPWNCMVCTFTNEPNHLACSACSTPRGESKWAGAGHFPL